MIPPGRAHSAGGRIPCTESMLELRPFQRVFVRRALAPGVRTAALSLPRGNGKSTLAAYLALRCLTPGDVLHAPGAEYVLLAASINQAVRGVFKPVRKWLSGDGDYRIAESANRATITHKPTGTVLRVISSSGKQAMGLVDVPLAIGDEPGSWEAVGGSLMFDALETAQGKPGSALRCIFIGTLAPATGGWWHEIVERGTSGSTYVQALQGDPERWDDLRHVYSINPLMAKFPDSRAVLTEERNEARADTRLKARFLSYRLNVPTPDESEVLLTVDDWKRTASRPVAIHAGKPIVGVDLGSNRAWSAAVAIWKSGRCEALAVAPGIPSIAKQEKRDRVPPGTYSRLLKSGRLTMAGGLRVVPAAYLIDAVRERWGTPEVMIADRFRMPDLKDTDPGCRIVPRISRWSESGFDIRALRKAAKDGPLSVGKSSRALLAASLSAAMVKPDDAGNVRMVKRGSNNTARDDVAAALVLAAGAFERASGRRRGGFVYHGAA